MNRNTSNDNTKDRERCLLEVNENISTSLDPEPIQTAETRRYQILDAKYEAADLPTFRVESVSLEQKTPNP